MAKEKEEKNESGDNIMKQARDAYGIDPKYVLADRYDAATGEVIIVTNGGSKVRFKAGDKVEKLDEIAITGINPKAAKRKVVAGKAKE
jgi:hypothetical protein